MTTKQQAAATLVLAIVVGAIAQGVARHEAAVLGLSALELAALGYVAGAALKRHGLTL